MTPLTVRARLYRATDLNALRRAIMVGTTAALGINQAWNRQQFEQMDNVCRNMDGP